MDNDTGFQERTADQAQSGPDDAVLYHTERTLVWRRPAAGGGGGLVFKQPLGPDAETRLRHETRMLERLAAVEGVPRLASEASDEAMPGAIALRDAGGESLAAALAAGPLSLPALLDLAPRLARIVAAVHKAGVLHKDINPANIVLAGPDQLPLLIDYDLATTFAEELPAFTHHDEITGTLAYLAPEQTGRTGRPVDQRADLYALGATLYQAATGFPPFGDDDPLRLIHAHLALAPEPPVARAPHLPQALSDLILRLLEKEPDRRYQSAEGLLHDLARLAAGAPPFALGENDFPRRLAPPSRLAGRERETAELGAAFGRARDGGLRGILVAGAPGVGKTALINELRAIATVNQGWFVSGKFDQYQPGADPAGMQALRALGRLLLAEPEAALAAQRERMLAGLGPLAGLVTALLPEFAILLGEHAGACHADPAEGDAQLHLALLDVLRAVVTPERPLVMVLDDLQWAGQPSIRFLDLLLTDEALRGLLLVGAYRDAEVGPNHPLTAMLPRWERLGVAPTLLRLENLAPACVGELLAGMLRLPAAAAAGLARVLAPHTGGNPYDTVELVNALRREGVLALGAQGWTWDPEAIRHYVGPGGVLASLTSRIGALPAPSARLLEIMACLGGEVAPALLCAASGVAPAALEEQLAPALEDGLLQWDMDGAQRGGLRFRHDRVQQAAYERLEPDALCALHMALARRLAPPPGRESDHDLEREPGQESVRESVRDTGHRHTAAAQYLACLARLRAPDECGRVVGLFMEAAAHARQITAHTTAERYLAAALDLARRPGCPADDARRLALEQERHAVLYQLGRLDEADEAYRRIAATCADPLRLAESAGIQIGSLMHRNRERAALDLGFPLLRQLGMALPERGLAAELPRHLDTFYRWFRERDLAADLARPEVREPRLLARMRLARQLIPPALFVDPDALAWLVLEGQRSWAEHGPSPELMFRLAHAGILTMAVREDYRTGYITAQHLLAVGRARGYTLETWQASFLQAISHAHWFEPLEDCVALAQRTREGLLQGGDWQVACYIYTPIIACLFECAPQLERGAAEIEAGLAFAARTGNEFNTGIFLALRQLLRALRGETRAPGSLADDDFDEARHLERIAHNPLAQATFHHCHALAAAMFGDAERLERHAAAAMALLPVMHSFYIAPLSYLLQALALAQAMHDAPPAAGAGLLARFDACRDWLAARAADAPANFGHMLRWLAAERAWAAGDTWAAAAAFDAALAAAETCRRPWHAALMTERAGRFHVEQGLERAGRQLLAEARQLYGAWGAAGKVRQMDQAYGLRRGIAPGAGGKASRAAASGGGAGASTSGGGSGVSADAIDLLAILRTSQALSSETSLERLCGRVIELIGSMTGATAITLALWDEDARLWRLPPADTGAALTIEEAGARGLLPISAFRYVERTRAPLLVPDATRDDRFARDPYVAGRQHCSLLVAPILSHGNARAMLLLENGLSHGAFSAGRLDAVMLVAGQLAVSLENAQLYASLERKVADRTFALEESNQRLALLSITDPLTGLANRRRFNEALEAEWLRALRPRSPIGAVMVDIDQFKLYNDHYGHQAGDNCLRLVATTLAAGFRQGTDVVARYGGEEFAVILPGTDAATTRRIADRARLAVAALNEPHAKAGHGIVTVSMGVAAMEPSLELRPERLFSAADSALYLAKTGGRNRVEGG
ncbi:diguanylate cyclase domain-containing protein [Pseudoduganella namucuonensis]|uniref:Diguanylate cyclase (GGDEF) domain-containing protein n=1 Tax=Pseudoduganella namucuonensis TaxID=1035707 RepID=A0A1I7KTK9_9BURK|nr:diguanylate cyclase [Pseudoduganella namucuonensis]SFV00737.1 diguanylate cyclase (GGDEF) domain-containing protein [Pseudoduganella namucuonensis]